MIWHQPKQSQAIGNVILFIKFQVGCDYTDWVPLFVFWLVTHSCGSSWVAITWQVHSRWDVICNAPILISLQGICTFVLVKQETDTSDPVWTVIEVDDLADSPYVNCDWSGRSRGFSLCGRSRGFPHRRIPRGFPYSRSRDPNARPTMPGQFFHTNPFVSTFRFWLRTGLNSTTGRWENG